jgi:hypothetical protein
MNNLIIKITHLEFQQEFMDNNNNNNNINRFSMQFWFKIKIKCSNHLNQDHLLTIIIKI